MSKDELKIKFMGEIPNENICELLNLADVLALPSKYEGSPTIIKEALACNLPVIATDVGDIKDVINSVSGGEIIELTINSFLEGLARIFARKSFNINTKNFQYGSDIMAKKTLEIYNKV